MKNYYSLIAEFAVNAINKTKKDNSFDERLLQVIDTDPVYLICVFIKATINNVEFALIGYMEQNKNLPYVSDSPFYARVEFLNKEDSIEDRENALNELFDIDKYGGDFCRVVCQISEEDFKDQTSKIREAVAASNQVFNLN